MSSSFWKSASIQPVEAWPGRRTPASKRLNSPLASDVTSTIAVLQKELAHLNASSIVLYMALTDPIDNLRKDGGLRADARLHHPGVILQFRTPKGEVFCKPFDQFRTWQENLRALAANLQHLRLAGLHGGEPTRAQYASWIYTPPPPTGFASDEGAAAFVARWSGRNAQRILDEPAFFLEAFREAMTKALPDLTHAAERLRRRHNL